jgi:hypothetical protein
MNITTKYYGPTDTRGARIKATCDLGTVTIPYPYELSGDACHQAASAALIKKINAPHKWIVEARPGLPPFGYAASMRDARKLQRSARRLGLTGSITRNGGEK